MAQCFAVAAEAIQFWVRNSQLRCKLWMRKSLFSLLVAQILGAQMRTLAH